MEITCNNEGCCTFKYFNGSLCGCNYTGYCDYQAPKDSRPLTIPPLCTCHLKGKCTGQDYCPVHG